MIVKKKVINDITKYYITSIKELFKRNTNINSKEEILVCSTTIAEKKMAFYLTLIKSQGKDLYIFYLLVIILRK